MRRKFYLFLLVAMLLPTSMLAQITVTGLVQDSNKEPLIGVSIAEKGGKPLGITDFDGKFEVKVASNGTLVFSYIGYETQEVAVNNRNNITVDMAEESNTLNEVVVVGYGTMKKKDLTGAIGSMKGDAISARKTDQVGAALQGAMSGVTVTRNNSEPGSPVSINVRGMTTISDSSPLVIIDGVPGDMNFVNPEDIESLTVLKDAASASIYGSRAAAGVILITTKRASDGHISLSYGFEQGWEIPTNMPKFVGPKRYMEMFNELRYNDNPDGGKFQRFTEDEVNNWTEYNKTDPDKYPITDWQDVLVKGSAPRQTHYVNIAGGSKFVQSKVSFRYNKVGGLYPNKDYNHFTIRANNNFKINKFIEANVDINYSRSKSVSPNIDPFQIQNMQIPSIYAVKWQNGMWGDVKDGANTMARVVDGGTKTVYNNHLSGKAGIDIMPVKGLKISAVVAPNYYFNKSKTFVKQLPYTYADDPTTIKGYMGDCFTTKLTEGRYDNNSITTQIFANYMLDIKRHSFTAMVGYEDWHEFREDMSASRDQYKMTGYPYLSVGPESFRDNSGVASQNAYRSVFGRVTYSYADRYLFQANIRRDGSSRFASENRWGTFPSFSAGWVISEEKFMEKTQSWLSYLKLRASWGTLGNERIGSYYPYQANLDFGSALFINGAEVVSDLTAAQQDYAVRDITWETTKTWDVGLDANFLDNRLFMNADFYIKETEDMLLQVQIPHFMGYNNPNINAGKMKTTGYDIEIGWRDRIGDFSYSAKLNFSDFVSKMGDMHGTQMLGARVKMEGSEFNEWYGFVSDGLFLTQDDLVNSPKLNKNVSLGDIKYKDISGPNGVPDGQISPEYDRVLLGGSLPRYTFGLNLQGAYKGFDLGIVLQGVGSQKARITNMMVEGFTNQWGDFPEVLDGNYWSSYKSDAENASALYPRLTYSNRSANYGQMSDYWLFNGRYLRLKNITLGYSFPKSVISPLRLSDVRVYVSGSDLFCLSNYPKGWDPERSTGSAAGYPITTSLLFGVSVQF